MASLKDIRRRIVSVKNTRQITRAMKMVASAKLRRAQDNIHAARPYAYRIYSMLLTLAHRQGVEHPLLVERPEKRVRLIVLAGDRGLCGAFNSNIFKATDAFIKEKEAQGVEISFEAIGKKTNDFYRGKRKIDTYHEGLIADGTYERAAEIADGVLTDYREGNLDSVYLVYNEFKSAIQQKVTVERLIPVDTNLPDGVAGVLQNSDEEHHANFVFEPSEEEMLNEVIPRHFKTQLYRAVLESVVSEHGARMSAMEAATNNASDMIDALTLEYNKARQAAITTELSEIVGGVEAMK